MNTTQILVLDFGSQYTQLIARRLREYGIYTEIVPYFESIDSIKARSPKGIILSGGPASVYEKDAYKPDPEIFNLNIPILGICYGMQYIADFFGGKVIKAQAQEFGKAKLEVNQPFPLTNIRITTQLPHFDALMQIWEKSVTKTHDFLADGEIEALKPEALEELKQSKIFVALHNDKPIAFLGTHENEITMFFVLPQFMHQGAGKKLLQKAFAMELKKYDVIKVTCSEQNLDAISCYKSLGFSIKGRSDLDKQGRPYPLCYLETTNEVLKHALSIIDTRHLIFSKLSDDDFSDLESMLKDKEVMKAWEFDFQDDDVKEWFHTQQERYIKYNFGLWSVRERKTGAFIGQVGLSIQDIGEGQSGVEIGYILRKEFWKRGLGFEAANACMEYAFKKLGQKRIYAIIKKDNDASIKLAQKLGMQPFREVERIYKGKKMPHIVYMKTCDNHIVSPLFDGVTQDSIVWMSHADKVEEIPHDFIELAKSGNTKNCAIANLSKQIYALQFHPEVVHSECGAQMLYNFATRICESKSDWNMHNFAESEIEKIRHKVQDGKVLCAVSGGVDSSVVATLLYRAIGERLIPVFVDTGLLRKGEREAVELMFKENLKVPLITVDASELFLNRLKGIIDPEKKRKIIGETFIEVFEAEAKKYNQNGEIKFLAQGTLYPDVIESVSIKGPSKTIKSHHNVGGLPDWMKFELIEPLRELFKDEVRALGRELGMPESMLMRHPFPGPGLAIRIMGEVNKTDLTLLKEADSIFIEELHKAGLYNSVWQAFCVLLNVRSVGVMGDNRTYDNAICLRAVEALDGMTATFSHLPHEFLESVSTKIINEVEGINRVVYDITSKPPGTIEWE